MLLMGLGCSSNLGFHGRDYSDESIVSSKEALGTQSLLYNSSTSITIDSDTHYYWNQLGVDEDKLVTYNGYQYSTYWDSPSGTGPAQLPDYPNGFPQHHLVLARRKLSDNSVQRLTFNSANDILLNPYDAHYNTVIGIDPLDGTLHLSYGHHNSQHHYRFSRTDYVTSPPATMAESDFTSASAQADGSIGAEGKLTYPKYFNDAAGNLYFAYRNGESSIGDMHLNAYSSSTHTWRHIGVVIAGKAAGTCTSALGCNLYPNTTDRGPYDMGFRFDRNNRLHVAWTWRENVTADANEHDVFYAYSDDSGTTWKNDGGTQIADLSATPPRPIRIDSGGVRVITVPEGLFVHSGFMTLDSHNQPHLVTKRCINSVLTAGQCNAQIVHYWRTSAGVWSGRYLTDTTQFTSIFRQGNGALALDGGDNAYFIHAEDKLGWHAEEIAYHPSTYEIPTFRWQTGGYVGGTALSSSWNPTTNENEAQISTDSISVPIGTAAGSGRYIQIKMQNMSAATQARFQFTTAATTHFSSVVFPISHNDVAFPADYIVDMATNPAWTGTLTYLTLNPVDNAQAGGDFKIDYINILDAVNTNSIVKGWGFTNPFTMVCSEANPTNDYSSYNAYSLGTGQAQVKWDEGYVFDAWRFKTDRILSVPSVEQNPSDGKIVYATRDFQLTNTAVARAWEFSENTEGWANSANITDFQWEPLVTPNTWVGGRCKGTIAVANSEIITTDTSLEVDITTNKHIQIITRNSTASTSAKFYFLTDLDTTWTESKSKSFTITANDATTSTGNTYTIDMSAVPTWTGKLRVLNYYPTNRAATTGTFSIDSIRIYP